MKRGAPIIAEYLGGAVNCDAYHMTDPRADGLGVSSCILSSLEDAGVSPEEVTKVKSFYSVFLENILLVWFLTIMPKDHPNYGTNQFLTLMVLS